MRILHLLSQRPGRSGSGVFLAAMVREAARRGYEQHAIAAGPAGTTVAELPPLIKGYLRLGARFGTGAVIDRQFGTTDVLVVLPVSAIDKRYADYYGGGETPRHAA